jgi:hypothetical protein
MNFIARNIEFTDLLEIKKFRENVPIMYKSKHIQYGPRNEKVTNKVCDMKIEFSKQVVSKVNKRHICCQEG